MMKPNSSRGRVDAAQAEALGLAALVFLVEDPARLTHFLKLTGLSPDELKAQAGEPAMLGAILDHLLGDESQLMVFTASTGTAPEKVEPARAVLARLAEEAGRQ